MEEGHQSFACFFMPGKLNRETVVHCCRMTRQKVVAKKKT